jgi:hypothetical protein
VVLQTCNFGACANPVQGHFPNHTKPPTYRFPFQKFSILQRISPLCLLRIQNYFHLALFFLSLHLYPAAVPCSQGNEADPRIKARETGGSSVALSGRFHGWRGFCTAVLGRYTNLRGLFCFFLRVELDRVPDLSWGHAGAGGLDKAGRWR